MSNRCGKSFEIGATPIVIIRTYSRRLHISANFHLLAIRCVPVHARRWSSAHSRNSRDNSNMAINTSTCIVLVILFFATRKIGAKPPSSDSKPTQWITGTRKRAYVRATCAREIYSFSLSMLFVSGFSSDRKSCVCFIYFRLARKTFASKFFKS